MTNTIFRVGDIVKFKNEFEPESEFYDKQEVYVSLIGYKFNEPYEITKIQNSFVYLENEQIGHLAERFELYDEELPEQVQVEVKSNLYCNCGGSWIENYACGKSFKICKACGKEVL